MSTLSKQRQLEIENKLNETLLSLNMSYPENDLLEIVNALKIDFFYTNLEKSFPDTKGIIFTKNNQSTIILDDSRGKESKLFTLAHELGHFILHKNTTGSKYRLDNYNNYDEESLVEEAEANYFAAILLIPENEFIKLDQEIGNELDKDSILAKYYRVSESAIKLRRQWLMTS